MKLLTETGGWFSFKKIKHEQRSTTLQFEKQIYRHQSLL